MKCFYLEASQIPPLKSVAETLCVEKRQEMTIL